MASYDKPPIGKFITDNTVNILASDNLRDNELISFMNEFEVFVKSDGKYISNGQVRILFDLISKTKDFNELQLIRPQIAFVTAKQIKIETRILIEKLLKLIGEVKTTTEHENMRRFITSFLHYHKFYHSEK
ncbi:type III-A CRISPR-associated protein Csm2 [Flectobacillus roseus]|uniref:CRISPR system Cms protein Csm2 n=1 Tax=Flectobacillus roseus TaxID=502259 RepID=A0ABT6Y658_9BACT|nr:type III-A CRISPR-associated protein Csm2 [Flectobacillus roseus]MDI9858939.1 type III-A CRISPR-associated protein Csm2 [Flectobacillus roseus]